MPKRSPRARTASVVVCGAVVGGTVVGGAAVVGTVGGADTPEGPHIEFQIRAPSEAGVPTAQDPLQWLRSRGGAP